MSSCARDWASQRTLHHSSFPASRLVSERTASVSVCLPARDEAETIGPIVRALAPLLDARAIDQLVVVDDSADGTADVARAAGADVVAQASIRPDLGPVRGKGDAMWRALAVLTGDVVCFLDADSGHFGPHFVTGLVGPIACAEGIAFTKAFYRRPFAVEDVILPEGGGRVTELCARPLLRVLFPELAEVRQPLAGEIAARRELLERLPFTCGYGVDVGLLIDAWRKVALGGLAQVDLDARQNRHQPLHALGPMADAVVAAIFRRAAAEGRLEPGLLDRLAPALERAPLALERLGA